MTDPVTTLGNEAPTITIEPGFETWDITHTDSNISVFAGVSFDDADDEDLTVTISFDPTGGDLDIRGSYTFEVVEAGGIKTYTFTGTKADLAGLTYDLKFNPDERNDGSGPIETAFTIAVKDASNGVVTGEVTVLATDETPGNTIPTIAVEANTETTTTTHTSANVLPFTGVSFDDANDDDLTLTIAFDPAGGRLVFPEGTPVQVVWDERGGRSYILTGKKDYLTTLMDVIEFDMNDDNAGFGTFETVFAMTVGDEFHSTPSTNMSVKVIALDPTPPNTAPTVVVESGTETTLATDTGANVTPFTGVSFDDADDDELSVTISFDPSGGDLVIPEGVTFQVADDAGVRTYTFTDYKAVLTALMDGVAFDPAPQAGNSGTLGITFTIGVKDSGHEAVTNGSITVVSIITDKNRAPINLQLGGGDGVSVAEGSTVVGGLAAEDEDGDVVTWSFDETAAGGGNAGGMFVIENGEIKLADGRTLEYDGEGAVRTHNVHVKASDGRGGVTPKSFTITVADVNEAPVNLYLSNSVIDESDAAVKIGTLSAVDPDGDTLSYMLVDAYGNEVTDTSPFEIQAVRINGAIIYRLATKAGIHVDADETHDVWVRASDGRGGETTEKFTITVTNVNYAPTDLMLSNSVIDENGTAVKVGTLTAVDADGDALSYLLVDAFGNEVTDSSPFEIQAVRTNGATVYRLATKDGIQVDADETRDLWVKVSDGRGGEATEKFTVTISNVNNAPANLALSNSIIDESDAAVKIGTLSAADVDGDTLSYLLVDEQGREVTDSSPFEIRAVRVNGVTTHWLAAKVGIQVDSDETRDVWVEVNDGRGGKAIERFTVTIKDVVPVNHAPTVAVVPGTATIQATDTGASVNPFTGVSFDDAEDDNLVVTISFDPAGGDLVFPEGAALQVTEVDGVRICTLIGTKVALTALIDDVAFDPARQAGSSGALETVFTLGARDASNATPVTNSTVRVISTITDKAPGNGAPTNIVLNAMTVREVAANGTVVGSLSAVDLDADDTFTFSLNDDRLEIVGDQLRVKDGLLLDFETARSHRIAITVQDKSGATFQKDFTIEVTDAIDVLRGTKGKDVLKGAIGSDQIWGGLGKDVLTGGKGKDTFVFDTRLNKKTNLDKIVDYNVKDDTIWLDNKYMSKIGKGTDKKPLKLNKAFFALDAAKDKDDHVIYNSKNGVVSYDIDGSGSKAAVEIVTLKKGLKMTAAEFFVI